MTNLSDLFPAGAGKQVSFTASGAISAAGKPVILNSAGTVTQVSAVAAATGTPVQFESGAPSGTETCYDAGQDRILIVYVDTGNSSYGTAVVCSISGTTPTFGTPVVFYSGNTIGPSCANDTNAGKNVIAYGQGDVGHVIVCTISGTTPSFGTSVVFNTPGNSNYATPIYDTVAQKCALGWADGDNGDKGSALVVTISGTTPSFGTTVVFEAGQTQSLRGCWDSVANKVVFSYYDQSNSNYGTSIVGTISGTSISFGTAEVFSSSSTELVQSAFDTGAGKVIVTYKNSGASNVGTAIAGSVSGTAISFGSPTVFETGRIEDNAITYDATAGAIVAAYRDFDVSGYGTNVPLTTSGSTITANTKVTFAAAATIAIAAQYHPVQGKVLIAYQADVANDGDGLVSTTASANLTATNFIGISDAAILDTASGNVTIKGGIATTGLTSLTPGSDYYAQDDGSITTSSAGVKIGKAMSATAINLEYQS